MFLFLEDDIWLSGGSGSSEIWSVVRDHGLPTGRVVWISYYSVPSVGLSICLLIPLHFCLHFLCSCWSHECEVLPGGSSGKELIYCMYTFIEELRLTTYIWTYVSIFIRPITSSLNAVVNWTSEINYSLDNLAQMRGGSYTFLGSFLHVSQTC